MFILFPSFKVVKIGDEGSRVEKIAQLLQKHGSKIKPTRKFTVGMKSAVTSFQKKHNLIPTGDVDKETWKELKKDPA